MTLENKLGITSSAELATQEERLSKKRALELFESGMLDKLDPAEALKRATFASALTIQSPGAADSIPTVDQVEAAMASGKLGTPEIQDNKQ